MFIAYKDEDKEQYISQSGLNPENLPALKIKTSKGDKFAFLKTSGENLSKVKANIGDKNYYLQKMNPVCIVLSTSSSFDMFTYLNGSLQKTNISINGAAEKNRRLPFIQFLPEYGAYIAYLYTESDFSSGSWNWFFTSLGSKDVAIFIGISFDGINFTFYPSSLYWSTQPLYSFYNKKTKILEIGCFYLSSSRPAVNVDTCKVLKFDIFNNTLTDSYIQSGISMINATVVKTEKGNIYYANHDYSATGFGFGSYGNWFYETEKSPSIYYNQTLGKIYIEHNNSFYYIVDADNTTKDDIKSCNESDFYKSYGNINGYEVFSETQIYKDFDNKIDLGETLYNLNPPTIAYDPYSKKYILVSSDSASIYIKETFDFKDYNTLYTVSKNNIKYCITANFFSETRTLAKRN